MSKPNYKAMAAAAKAAPETPAPAPVVWDKAKVQKLLAENDKAVARALLLVYARQTASEQAAEATTEHNGVGFAALDAEILSSFAKFYKRAGFLTAKQMAVARKKVMKYWRQILNDMAGRGYTVVYK